MFFSVTGKGYNMAHLISFDILLVPLQNAHVSTQNHFTTAKLPTHRSLAHFLPNIRWHVANSDPFSWSSPRTQSDFAPILKL